LVRDISALSLLDRWTIYRAHRIDHQIEYFTRRARERGAASRRWLMLRLLLTAATVGVVVVALAWPAVLPVGTTGLVSSLLATVEAWIQFRRSEVIAASYRGARAELASLTTRPRWPRPSRPSSWRSTASAGSGWRSCPWPP
jgi:hypothetical protein